MTLFVDIDGVLLKHEGGLSNILYRGESCCLLSGVIKKINEWESKNYKIILTTGRRESMRSITEKQLISMGIFYDMLLMGLPSPRCVINDKSIDGQDTAFAVNVSRDEGLDNINV